jgi:hypothetical protein
MEDSDALRRHSDVSTTISKATSLAEKCRKLAAELEEWHEAQETQGSGPRSWQQPSIFRPSGAESPLAEGEYYLEECLYFPSFPVAFSELLYSTCLLLLYSTHCMTCGWLKATLGSAIALLPEGDDAFSYPEKFSLHAGAHKTAFDIAMSLEYFINPAMGGVGAGLIGFPVAVAMGFFQFCNLPELAWFDTVLRYVRREYDIPLDTFLESMATGEILKLVRQP